MPESTATSYAACFEGTTASLDVGIRTVREEATLPSRTEVGPVVVEVDATE